MLVNISSVDAYEILKSKRDSSILFDVRTQQEWEEAIADLSNICCISWRVLPDMVANPLFAQNILDVMDDKYLHLFFICHRGGRSGEAMSFTKELLEKNNDNIKRTYYNIIDGFSYQGATSWVVSGLPIKQYCGKT